MHPTVAVHMSACVVALARRPHRKILSELGCACSTYKHRSDYWISARGSVIWHIEEM